MANVLLLIPTNSTAGRATKEAVELARAHGGNLLVAVVIDPAVIERVSTTLDEVGLMGERIGDGVRSALKQEYRTRAEESVAAALAAAERAGVTARGIVEEGDPTDLFLRLVPQNQIGSAILVAERRSWLTKLLAGAPLRPPELPGCEVRLIEDEG